MTIEFQAWPKTPRLFREIVITEKIDGTNSAVIIEEINPELDYEAEGDPFALAQVESDGHTYAVAAQSRNRLITPGKTTDNYGFAGFVQKNAEALFDLLGPGRHFGEWWGKGIQGRYKAAHPQIRGFALFNTAKYKDLHTWLPMDGGIDVIVEPTHVLYEGPFSEKAVRDALERLKKDGSWTSPLDKAEGIVVYHTQSRQVFKVTLDGEDAGKWEGI
ncbi:MAG TPA: RNA ligase family protein [Candidatus Paceibacterota bacterium]